MPRFASVLIAIALWQPAFAQDHAERAAAFVQHGDLKSAEAELRQALALSPEDPVLLTSLGGVLGMRGDLGQANVYLAKAVHLKPQDPLLLRNLAANEWQLGRFAEAHRHLQQLIQANPQDKGAIFLLGMVSENQKDYRHSIALLESIPDVAQRQPEALVALASSYYHTHRPEDARSALKKLTGLSARPQVMYMGARVAMDAHEYAIAENLFSSIRATYSDPAALASQLALAQYRQGRAADSEKTIHDALAVGHANREAYLLFCKLLADHGDYNQALRFASEATQKFPDSHEAYSTRGAMEMKLQYFSAAVSSLKRAAELNRTATTQRELALAEWRAGNRSQAKSGFEEAIRRYPRDAETYQVYGTLLMEEASPEAKTRAIDLFQRAVTLDDAAVEAHFQLANAALTDGKLEDALAHLEKALRSARDDSRLHFTLSRVYRRMGRDADADREMEEYGRLKK